MHCDLRSTQTQTLKGIRYDFYIRTYSNDDSDVKKPKRKWMLWAEKVLAPWSIDGSASCVQGVATDVKQHGIACRVYTVSYNTNVTTTCTDGPCLHC